MALLLGHDDLYKELGWATPAESFRPLATLDGLVCGLADTRRSPGGLQEAPGEASPSRPPPVSRWRREVDPYP